MCIISVLPQFTRTASWPMCFWSVIIWFHPCCGVFGIHSCSAKMGCWLYSSVKLATRSCRQWWMRFTPSRSHYVSANQASGQRGDASPMSGCCSLSVAWAHTYFPARRWRVSLPTRLVDISSDLIVNIFCYCLASWPCLYFYYRAGSPTYNSSLNQQRKFSVNQTYTCVLFLILTSGFMLD